MIVPSASAAEMTARLNRAEFLAAREGHFVARPGGKLALPKIEVVGEPRLHFCGPFFLQDAIGQIPSDFPTEIVYPDAVITRQRAVICLPAQVAFTRTGGVTTVFAESFNSYWERLVHGRLPTAGHNLHVLEQDMEGITALDGPYLYMDCQHESHFGHIMADVLSLSWAYRALVEDGVSGLRALVTHNAAPFVFELMEAAGVPRSQIVQVRRPVLVEEMYFATKAFLVQGWTSPLALETWDIIRHHLDEGFGPEKIFVSRPKGGNRALLNWEAVEAIHRSRGFEIVYPEALPIKEQVRLFANARRISGLSGSGLFSLAYARKLDEINIAYSPNFVHFSEILMLAHSPHLQVKAVIGHSAEPRVHADWDIDTRDLELGLN